jgi:type I restriction enzyme S subunit
MKKQWDFKKLGDLYSFKNGINFNKEQKNGNGVLTIDVLNMYGKGLKINVDNLYRIDKNISEEFKLQNGDILIVRSSVKEQGVAWATFFEEVDEPVTYCGFIIRGRPLEVINPEYVVYYLRSAKVRKELISKAVKSTITNINQNTLSQILIPVPPLEEQKRIVNLLNESFSLIADAKDKSRKELDTLDELENSILQNAFNKIQN